MVSRQKMGRTLATKRCELGLSQSDVCRAINTSRTSVANWEAGVVSPRLDTLVQLADLYGCTLDELAGKQ